MIVGVLHLVEVFAFGVGNISRVLIWACGFKPLFVGAIPPEKSFGFHLEQSVLGKELLGVEVVVFLILEWSAV